MNIHQTPSELVAKSIFSLSLSSQIQTRAFFHPHCHGYKKSSQRLHTQVYYFFFINSENQTKSRPRDIKSSANRPLDAAFAEKIIDLAAAQNRNAAAVAAARQIII
jgi:hypothetical protein